MKRFVKENWYLMILKLGRVGGSTKHLKINVTVASTASTSLGGGGHFKSCAHLIKL